MKQQSLLPCARAKAQQKKPQQVKIDAFVSAENGVKIDEDVQFKVPFLPLTSPSEPTPAAFRATTPLYAHQQRSLYRMLQIENQDEEVAKFNFGHLDYIAKGGCLADAIGMGKTATMLALIVSEPINVNMGGNLLVAPPHLLQQWKMEVEKFVQPGEIQVVIGLRKYLTIDRSQISNRTLVLVGVNEILESQAYLYDYRRVYHRDAAECARVYLRRNYPPLPVSLDVLEQCKDAALYVNNGYSGLVWVSPAHMPEKPWRRVIFEEVQDLVLPGKTSQDCFIQLTRQCEHVWLITATPFPQQAESIYANNQLLGFKRLRLQPHDPAFDQIKRNLYLRNCAQVKQDAITSRIQVQETYVSVKLHPKELVLYMIEETLASTTSFDFDEEAEDPLDRTPQETPDTKDPKSFKALWGEKYKCVRQSCVHVGISDRILERSRPARAEVGGAAAIAIKPPTEVYSNEKYHLDRQLSILKRRIQEFEMLEAATRNTIAILQTISKNVYWDVKTCFDDTQASGLAQFFNGQGNETSAGFRMTQKHAQGNSRLPPEPAELILYLETEIEDYLLKHWDSSAAIQRLCSMMELTLERMPSQRTFLQDQLRRLQDCIALKQQVDANANASDRLPAYGSKILHLLKFLQRMDRIKVVVFSMWTTALRTVEKALASIGISAAVFLEHQSSETKAAHVLSFIQGSTQVLLLNSLTSASGINLQVASHVIFLDPVGYSPAQASTLEQQAIGRVLRMGQTNSHVSVVRFVAEQTLEAALYDDIHTMNTQVQKEEATFFDGQVEKPDDAYVCLNYDAPLRRIVRMEIRGHQLPEEDKEDEDQAFDIVGAMSLEEAINQRVEAAQQQGCVLDLTDEANASIEQQLKHFTPSKEQVRVPKRRRMMTSQETMEVPLETVEVKQELHRIKHELKQLEATTAEVSDSFMRPPRPLVPVPSNADFIVLD